MKMKHKQCGKCGCRISHVSFYNEVHYKIYGYTVQGLRSQFSLGQEPPWRAGAMGLRRVAACGDAPPILFLTRQKENGPCTVQEKKRFAARNFPLRENLA